MGKIRELEVIGDDPISEIEVEKVVLDPPAQARNREVLASSFHPPPRKLL